MPAMSRRLRMLHGQHAAHTADLSCRILLSRSDEALNAVPVSSRLVQPPVWPNEPFGVHPLSRGIVLHSRKLSTVSVSAGVLLCQRHDFGKPVPMSSRNV